LLIEIIGYWCLFVAVLGAGYVIVFAAKNKVDPNVHVYIALYFIAAIMALR